MQVIRDVENEARSQPDVDAEDPEAVRLQNDLAGLADREAELTHDHYVDELIGRDAFMSAMGSIRERREAVERALSKLGAGDGRPSWTREQLASMEGRRRRWTAPMLTRLSSGARSSPRCSSASKSRRTGPAAGSARTA